MNKNNFKNNKQHFSKNRLIIGRKPLLEALSGGKDIDKIFVLKSASGPEIDTIRKNAQVQNIPLSRVPVEKLNRFTNANHQGVIAIAGLTAFQPLQEIISRIVETGKAPFLVASDGITDTRNLGAIARAAYCFNADALIIPASNNAAITEDAIKTSAGALEHLPVCRVKSIEEAFDILQLNGIQTVAAALSGTQTLSEIDCNLPVAWILGAEDKGVSKFVLKHSDHLARIPMSEQFDSLNVAVAAGVLFYETFKQRADNFEK